MHRRAIIFAGRVQGVGFRATAQAVAARFRVSGWVRNEPDSTVRLEVQGPPEEVEAMVRNLSDRMRRSIVSTRSEELPVVPQESGFDIRR
jgi:acylphosphatase